MSFLKSSSSISEAKSTLGLALVLATVLVVLVVGLFESNIKATAESQTFTALEESAASAENAANSQVRKYINALNFLHQTPPISGIVRASENENLDPKDGTTLEQWKQRLETIFVAFIENNEEVDQLRIIQANEDGSEFIRVERNGGSVLVVKDNDLQPKAARSYFIESVKRNKGEFYISDINLNREYGKLEFPYKSVIRLSLPIFSSSGERYGFIIMNVNAQFLLSQMEQTLVGNQLLFVTDSEGFFVSHPDSDKSFSRDLNPMVNWASEFESPSKIGRAKIKQTAQTNSSLYTVTRAFTINGNQQTAP
ncbi:MAG TPA: hybrid sensor histidine kinase/response regulator, partial [Alteromonas macleodii]|nr:hybrid sensor histidine kinase/response regulator [Alteromonas macleodii]